MAIFNLLASDIENLDLKLAGKLPVNRDELLALANSWGRKCGFYTYDKDNERIYIKDCEKNECYNLSKLDVSEIKNFEYMFTYSKFYGDISLWDVSNATSMFAMFFEAYYFNSSLNSWNIPNVKNLSSMFAYTKSFNKPVLWDLSKIEKCSYMFFNAKAFFNKFNKDENLPNNTTKIKAWLIENRPLMEALEIKNNKGKDLDNFLLDFDIITSTKLNGLHNNRKIDDGNI